MHRIQAQGVDVKVCLPVERIFNEEAAHMVGMGSVVTRSVPDFHLMVGNPARSIGCVCRCGEPLLKWSKQATSELERVACIACKLTYEICDRRVVEIALNSTSPVDEHIHEVANVPS